MGNWNSGILMDVSPTNPDLWTVTLPYNASSAGQTLEMKPLKGDVSWSIGANFQVRIPNESSSVAIYPWFWSHSGNYEVIGSVYSPQLNNTIQIVVYTPPSYYENTLKTMNNVLVMHDGQNLF